MLDDVAVEHGRGHGASAPLLHQLVQRVEDDALHAGEPISYVGKWVSGA